MCIDDKAQYVRDNYLNDALKSLRGCRRYWNSSMSRTMTGYLSEAIRDSGLDTLHTEVPPQWEHVFYLSEDASIEYFDELKSIAKKRVNHELEGKDLSARPI